MSVKEKNKRKIRCAVNECKSNNRDDPNISFFRLPPVNTTFVAVTNNVGEKKIVDRRTVWKQILRRHGKVFDDMRICSLHFSEEDFQPPSVNKKPQKRPLLRKSSVPLKNLSSIFKRPKLETGDADKNAELESTIVGPDDNVDLISSEPVGDEEIAESTPGDTVNIGGNMSNAEETSDPEQTVLQHQTIDVQSVEDEEDEAIDNKDEGTQTVKTTLVNISVQVNTNELYYKFMTFISSDQELSTATGILSFSLLNTIEQLVIRVDSSLQEKYRIFTLRDVIVMTMMKLKQNIRYSMLAILFKCAKSTCSQHVINMIDILNTCLKPAVVWPSKENFKKNIPLCIEGFEDARVVVDCTEIYVQEPSKLCCQIQIYSYYKSKYTVKFMTGTTPSGIISFISKPYGGRVSNNVIFEQSGILKILEKNDVVMAAKGFTVKDLCKRHDVKLLTPYFLKKKKQFSQAEAITNRKVAKTRVHIERINQRIKTFAILSDVLPMCLFSRVGEIFNIVCGVVNLSAPILKNDKFHS